MNAQLRTQVKATPPSSFTPVRSGLSRWRYAGSGAPGLSGECDACRTRRSSMAHRASTEQAQLSEVSPAVRDVLRSPGQSLDPKTRAFMETRFRHDFSRVRVHNDEKAAESARMLNALAYTAGRDVVFGASQYAPETGTGQRVLAHELMHVVQQREGEPRSLSPVTSAVHEEEAHRASAAIASPSLRPVPRTAAGPVGGVQCVSPATSSITDAPVYIKANPLSEKHPTTCGKFDWPINWETNGRDGYIIQEIRWKETIKNCDLTPYKETDPEKIKYALPPHFWEAWRVAADGRFYPDKFDGPKENPFEGGDNWTRFDHPNTRDSSWETNGNVYWTKELDPAAHFDVGTDVKSSQLPSTTTQPRNLGPVLLTRHAAGHWDCCNGVDIHTAW